MSLDTIDFAVNICKCGARRFVLFEYRANVAGCRGGYLSVGAWFGVFRTAFGVVSGNLEGCGLLR